MRKQQRRKGMSLSELAEYILEECVKNPETGCLEWPHCVQVKWGYGHIGWNGKILKTHRVVLESKEPGFMDSGLQALHSCDNPKCNNPDHLRSGTSSENHQDCISRGRDLNRRKLTSTRFKGRQDVKGEDNGAHRLKEPQVIEIWGRLQTGKETIAHLARCYEVGESTVRRIRDRTHWRHITGNL